MDVHTGIYPVEKVVFYADWIEASLRISGGPFWAVPELLFESKNLIPALQQLLIAHQP